MSKSRFFELKMPKFLLAVEPIEMPSGFHYIYSPHYLSLILVIRTSTQQLFLNYELQNNIRKLYECNENEKFELIIIQNNVNITGGELAPVISELQFLDEAWDWYKANMIKL